MLRRIASCWYWLCWGTGEIRGRHGCVYAAILGAPFVIGDRADAVAAAKFRGGCTRLAQFENGNDLVVVNRDFFKGTSSA